MGLGTRGGTATPAGLVALTPQTLFTAGDTGGWWTSDDNTYLTVNSDGTGGAVADGGTIGRWLDRSGSTEHVSQATANIQPVYLAGKGVNNFYKIDPLQANLSNVSITAVVRDAYSGGFIMDIPSIGLTPLSTFGTNQSLIVAGNTTSTEYPYIRVFDGVAYISTNLKATRRLVVTWSGGTGAFKIWVNGVLLSMTAHATASMTRIFFGAYSGLSYKVPVRYHEFAFFRRALTDLEMFRLNDYFLGRGGTKDTTRIVALLGDSNSVGVGSFTNQPWHFRCTQKTNSTWLPYAHVGQTIAAPNITAATINTFKASVESIAIINMGTADLGLGTSGATTETNLAAYALTLKNAGWKVIVTKLQQVSGHDTEAQAFNTLLSANYLTYAHALVDLRTPFPDCTDTTYFNTDQVHFKDAAHAIIAPLFDTALAAL